VIEWLDRQTTGSVVYVSFGSAGSLSVEQTAELAAGLEDSGHRFLWVVRMPSLDGINFAMFIGHMSDKDDPLAWLPEGFVERTSGRGLAVAAWAPQARVLSHPATAALVSRCGWNSTLESVASGMPMVAWPLYAEQRMERRGPVGLIAREEIPAAVREVMGGEEKGARCAPPVAVDQLLYGNDCTTAGRILSSRAAACIHRPSASNERRTSHMSLNDRSHIPEAGERIFRVCSFHPHPLSLLSHSAVSISGSGALPRGGAGMGGAD
jgi:hypothetical protein